MRTELKQKITVNNHVVSSGVTSKPYSGHVRSET